MTAETTRLTEDQERRIAALKQERRLLDNKPFGVRIAPLQADIDRRIAAVRAEQ